MKIILMLCTGGITSQYFLQSLKTAIEDHGQTAVIDYGNVLYDLEKMDAYDSIDYLLLFAPATVINKDAIQSSFMPIDLIMLSPQVRYLYQAMKPICDQNKIDLMQLDPTVFAERDGHAIYAIIQ